MQALAEPGYLSLGQPWAGGQPIVEVCLHLRPALGGWGLRQLGDSGGRCPGGAEGIVHHHLEAVDAAIFEGMAVN